MSRRTGDLAVGEVGGAAGGDGDERADPVREQRPDDGTWCEAWTVRDVLVHQTGNAEELARVLQAFLDRSPVETRGFDREEPFRRLSDAELWVTFLNRCERLTEVAAAAAQDLSPDTEVMWTGRSVQGAVLRGTHA